MNRHLNFRWRREDRCWALWALWDGEKQSTGIRISAAGLSQGRVVYELEHDADEVVWRFDTVERAILFATVRALVAITGHTVPGACPNCRAPNHHDGPLDCPVCRSVREHTPEPPLFLH